VVTVTRPVIVDEVLLLGRAEGERVAREVVRQPPEAVVPVGVPGCVARHAEVGQVDATDAPVASEGEEVEAERPARVLRPPPGVDCGEVGQDRRETLREAIRRVGRDRVEDWI